ncbi:hypothetical protein B0H12DRAFT_1072399 [Mycena haematopus]|nr:hypothetical protein B0H12DRAFT_1072399 [Mycena haematopus]
MRQKYSGKRIPIEVLGRERRRPTGFKGVAFIHMPKLMLFRIHPPGHGSPYAPMTLNLSKKFRGVKQDFFRAGDHQCDFVELYVDTPHLAALRLLDSCALALPLSTTASPPSSPSLGCDFMKSCEESWVEGVLVHFEARPRARAK